MGPTEYVVVVPITSKVGPGHRSHLSPDGGKTALCHVEKNAHGLEKLFPNRIRPSTSIDRLYALAVRESCRKPCKNCWALAGRL